ncbi:MAG: cupin domain-containing protein [Halobacteria archaeon]
MTEDTENQVINLGEIATGPTEKLFQNPTTVGLNLERDDEIPPHSHPGTEIVLHLCEGEIELGLDDERLTLKGGDVTKFDGGKEISLKALERSAGVLFFG